MSPTDFSREVDLDSVFPTRTVDLDGGKLGLYLLPGKTQLVLERGGRKFVIDNQKTDKLWREYFYRKLLNTEKLFVSYSNEGLFGGRLTITVRAYANGLIKDTFPKGRYVSSTFPIIVDTSGDSAEITFLTPDGLNEWYGVNMFVPVAVAGNGLFDGEQYRSQLENNTLAIMLNGMIDHDILSHAVTFAEMMKSKTGERYREIMANVRAIYSNPRSVNQLKVAREVAKGINNQFEISTGYSTTQLIVGNREPFNEFIKEFDAFLEARSAEIKAVINQ